MLAFDWFRWDLLPPPLPPPSCDSASTNVERLTKWLAFRLLHSPLSSVVGITRHRGHRDGGGYIVTLVHVIAVASHSRKQPSHGRVYQHSSCTMLLMCMSGSLCAHMFKVVLSIVDFVGHSSSLEPALGQIMFLGIIS